MSPLAVSWKLCWQKMSCLGQSLGVKALNSGVEEVKIAGIAFIEALILTYTEPSTLSSAGRNIEIIAISCFVGNSQGVPSADMLLFNSRYLMDQMAHSLSTEDLSGKGPLVTISTIANVVTQRNKYFETLVPHILKLTQREWCRVSSASVGGSKDAYNAQLASVVKKSLLSLLRENISTRQKSMIMYGLSQLGSKDCQMSFIKDTTTPQLTDSSWYSIRQSYVL